MVGETISTFGTLISVLALPFVALLYLHRGAGALAVVGLAEMVPGFFAGLFAGVWVDRLSCRQVLVVTNAVRFGLVGLVPLLAWTNVLTMAWLVVIAALTGLTASFYAPAYRAMLPLLVAQDELTNANSLIEGANAAAEVLAFASAGFLVQLLRAPTAIFIDALTFAVAALLAVGLPKTAAAVVIEDRRRLMVDLREGLATVHRQAALRSLAFAAVAQGITQGIFGTLILLHITTTLGYPTGPQGLVYAVGGVMSIAAATVAPTVIQRLGLGRATAVGMAIGTAALLFVVWAPGPSPVGYSMLTAQQIFGDLAWTVATVASVSIRQRVTPKAVRGRVESTVGTAAIFGRVLGLMLGGWLGVPSRLGSGGGLGLAVAISAVSVVLLAPLWRFGPDDSPA